MSTPPRPITAYLPQGGFGHDVVRRLAGPRDVVAAADDGLVGAYLPHADRLVLVCDPDRTDLRKDLDTLSFERSVPSVGLELSPTELRCGPLVVPGRTACYSCYTSRRRQHGYRPLPEGLDPLRQGYAHHHVVIGAGLVGLALDVIDGLGAAALQDAPGDGAGSGEGPSEGPAAAPDATPGTDIGGRVWTIDLVSGVTGCARTVAVDRCEICSKRYAQDRDGVPALAALLPRRREVA